VNGRARHVLTAGGTAFVGSTFLSDNGLISVGAGSAYHAGNFTHFGGTLTIDPAATFDVTGRYAFGGGTTCVNSGPMRIESTGGLEVNAATFGASVDNFGSLQISTNTNFTTSLTNRAPFTILGPRVITAERWDQRAGTITQFGETHGGFYWVQGGATWNLMGGIHTQATQIAVGFNAGDGTYAMAGGSINMNGFSTARIIVGMTNSGSFLQGGGDVKVPFLYVGGSGSLGSGRGFYRLDAGSLLCTGQMWVGTENAAGGTYVQTGGRAEVQRLIANDLSTSNSSIQISGGSLLIHASSINNGSWSQTGGAARVEEFLDGAGSISVTGTGSFTTSRLRQRAVFIGDNGRVINNDILGTSFNQLNRVNSLTIEEAGPAVRGTWNLDNTLLAIDYTGASPLPAVQRYLTSGYAGGSWNGTGINSTMVAAFGLAEGYAEASDVLGPGGGTFNGEPVDGTTVLVRYAFYGDANLDGRVNLSDFNRMAANFGGTNKVWSQGDFTYDGRVNLDDFNKLAANFGMSFGPTITPDDWVALASAVPEPSIALTSFGVAAAAAMSTSRSRRRRT